MTASFRIDADPLGDGTIEVNGEDVSHLVAAAQVMIQPGHPTTLTLHANGAGRIEGHGVVHVAAEVDAADVAAEVGEMLRGIDGAAVWEAMMSDPSVDLSDPAGAFLDYVADMLCPVAA